MKKISFFLVFIMICSICVSPAFAAPADAVAPYTSALSAIVIDAESGVVLHERNANAKMPIASTTKILTALVVIENCDVEETVEIKPEYTSIEGSSIYLKAGEKLTVRELLYGLMLESGNDAAVALACHTAGSTEAFAQLQNAKLTELGCADSTFKNPHGLDVDGQYSTARDLAVFTAAAMKNDIFCDIVSTKTINVAGRYFVNHNRLLWSCDGALGVKTGYTKVAGRSLVSCVERDGMRLVCVTLSDPNDWCDHEAMYNWAFAKYNRIAVSKDDVSYGNLPVLSGTKESVSVRPDGDYSFVVSKHDEVAQKTDLPKFVDAGVKAGECAGTLTVIKNNEEIAVIPLVFTEDVELDESVPLTRWEKIKCSLYIANKYGAHRDGCMGY